MTDGKLLVENLWRYTPSERVNDPKDYIAYLKTQPRFKGCSLDSIPPSGIILHDARVEEHLVKLGYSESEYRLIATGTTDPNIMYLVHGHGDHPDFILNRGLPGAGGITTQAAELGALGVKRLVHIGTCGLVGDEVKKGEIVVAQASYKDGAAVMLTDSVDCEIDPLARADEALSTAIREALATDECHDGSSVGYTIPIFYFQPLKLIHDLITGEAFPSGPRVGYFEMEEASFFETCRQMGLQGASLVVGADRYRLEGDKVTHAFEEDVDQDAAKLAMIKASLSAFKKLSAEPAT
jgi:uridine phosphorylase